jgi:hypothetical protein
MNRLIAPALLASMVTIALAGCAVYPAAPGPGVDVNVAVGWHGDRYWDGHRYWERAEWERAHPPRDDRGDQRRWDDNNRQY